MPAHVEGLRWGVLYSTLSPCDMCSGTALLYKIPRIVIGENRTFRAPKTTYARGASTCDPG